MKQKKQKLPQVLPNADIFVTPREIAPALRRTETGIRWMLAEGKLPGKKIGGRWFMFRKDFEALITPDSQAA